ncbi:MAG TPA: sigma-70 family RNA polymerase sigma factor [Candidatus Kapabacteria bacterium]|nr:sigma-70 family RNA polymerase sigma factor [Candidatus Kapabacteria bacterium]
MIVRKYQQRIYWVVRRLIPDHDDADDVAQEVFVRAYQALQDFRADSQLFTWLYRIAVNVAMNHKRKSKLREMVDIDEMISHPAADDPSPDEALERGEYKEILEDAIESLPEKQRLVFQMRYFEEMPYEEMAKVLHKSVGGLKANYFHAVRKVAAYVRKVHGERGGDADKDITEEKE